MLSYCLSSLSLCGRGCCSTAHTQLVLLRLGPFRVLTELYCSRYRAWPKAAIINRPGCSTEQWARLNLWFAVLLMAPAPFPFPNLRAVLACAIVASFRCLLRGGRELPIARIHSIYIAHVARNNHIVKSVHCLTNQDHRATSCRRKGEGTVLLSFVKDNQSVEEKSLGFMRGFVRTEARSSGKLRRDITT